MLGNTLQLANLLQRQAAAGALIGLRGIGEAVAQYPGPAFQRGQDAVADVDRAGGKHQQQLGRAVERFRLGLEQQSAQRLSHRRPAGFASHHALDALPRQMSCRQCNLRGLADSLDAFERDELAAHRHWFPSRRELRKARIYRATLALCSSYVRAKRWRPSPSPVATK